MCRFRHRHGTGAGTGPEGISEYLGPQFSGKGVPERCLNWDDGSSYASVTWSERDAIKATALSQLAQSLDTKFTVLPGEEHGIPLNPVWQTVAVEIDDWLTGLFG
jgi:hypothetical protein